MSTAKGLFVRAAAESQVGFAHGNNEDNVYFNGDYITPRTINDDFAIKTGEYSDINVFAVLDGMGRNNTGSFASLLAATRLDEVSDQITYNTEKTTDEIVLSYINDTNELIRNQVHETGGIRTATTLALLVIENGNARVYNAGDSRVYLYRDKELIKLTRDHVSVKGQRSVALTEEGVRNGGLTKYLGMAEKDGSLEPYRAKPFKVKKGDKFLVCSDGITDYVDEDEIAACLMRRKDPFGHTNELMALALREECADNLSAVVVDIVEPGVHLTLNMILTALGCFIMIAGILIGFVFGYVIGGAGKVPIAEQDGIYNLDDGGEEEEEEGFDTPAAPTTTGETAAGDTTTSAPTAGTTGDAAPTTSAAATPTVAPPVNGNGLGGEVVLGPTTTAANTAEYAINDLDLNKKDFTLIVGDTYTIKAEYFPIDVPSSAIKWKSSNPEVVSVDETGKVKALKRGHATITAYCGAVEATCEVYVKNRT
ncbi:MAG: Ig-like domain-containing protein [Oscillospiraceae bacterium]|jgi:protein phosphatase|nr:Ig-like domain-containing protein [Oscillospiraceae bacterium]